MSGCGGENAPEIGPGARRAGVGKAWAVIICPRISGWTRFRLISGGSVGGPLQRLVSRADDGVGNYSVGARAPLSLLGQR